MSNKETTIDYTHFDDERESLFKHVWEDELPDVFSDVADYYDSANNVASLGLDNWLVNNFISTIEVQANQKVLDICAGTNVVGIALLKKQADLQVTSIDRSNAMQEAGQKTVEKLGLTIDSIIGDVHKLPFPDNCFDIITLRYASRHLRIYDVCQEVKRVLKPGAYFYHNDIFHLDSSIAGKFYYAYLRGILTLTATVFNSDTAALNCRDYFIQSLKMFYTTDTFSTMLKQTGFNDVSCKTVLGGTIGFHKARK